MKIKNFFCDRFISKTTFCFVLFVCLIKQNKTKTCIGYSMDDCTELKLEFISGETRQLLINGEKSDSCQKWTQISMRQIDTGSEHCECMKKTSFSFGPKTQLCTFPCIQIIATVLKQKYLELVNLGVTHKCEQMYEVPYETSLDTQDLCTELPDMTAGKLGSYGATLQARHGIPGFLKGTRSQ